MRLKRSLVVAVVLLATFVCGLLLASCGRKSGGEEPTSTVKAGKKDLPKPGGQTKAKQ